MAFTNELTRGMIINFNNAPHILIEKEFYSPGKGAAFTRTKLKNIQSGKIVNQVFKSGEKVDQLDIDTRTMQFLYADDNDAYFMDPVNFDQINVNLDIIDHGTELLHPDGKYIIISYEGKAISVQLPSKLTLEVTETSDATKGNTSGNATKDAILETGFKTQVPLFIKQGEKIIINTETGLYVSKEA